jgi:hypothetical protein
MQNTTRAGASAQSIMKTSGHRKVETVFEYIEETQMFEDSASALLGL